MKRVPLTDTLRERLQAANADPDKVVVYEGTALSTRPVRKQHPLYLGARHTRNFLQNMAAELAAESRPLQIMHDGSELPIGRVFYGGVIDNDMGGSELRVQFWVDSIYPEQIALIDHGTVDQVSVSVIGKSAKCSECGFDYFGDDADIDNIWGGFCDKGHEIGKDGVHVVINELDGWNEMSLVNRGGSVAAFIHDQSTQRLAASGNPRHLLSLTLSDLPETSTMDMTTLIKELTDAKASVLSLTAAGATHDAAVAALNAQITELNTKIAELQTKADTSDAHKATADALQLKLVDVVKHVLSMKGDVTTSVAGDADAAALFSIFDAAVKDLKLVAAPAPSKGKSAEMNASDASLPKNSAFKRSI